MISRCFHRHAIRSNEGKAKGGEQHAAQPSQLQFSFEPFSFLRELFPVLEFPFFQLPFFQFPLVVFLRFEQQILPVRRAQQAFFVQP